MAAVMATTRRPRSVTIWLFFCPHMALVGGSVPAPVTGLAKETAAVFSSLAKVLSAETGFQSSLFFCQGQRAAFMAVMAHPLVSYRLPVRQGQPV